MPGRDSNRASRGRTFAALWRGASIARFEARYPRLSLALFAALPALLAGFELAVLTLFLNADEPRSALALGGATLAGALLAAPFSLLAIVLAARRRGGRTMRPARLAPWSITAVLVAAAIGDWVHASRYSFYLAPAVGANLIKLALWLSLGAIFYFYTALLHTVHHRRYGPRSIALLLFAGLGAVYVSLARLASAPAGATPSPVAAVRVAAGTPRLAVVTIAGATLDVFLPLARQSRLPFFSSLVEGGAAVRLESVVPVMPLAARTSLATGKLPWRHNLLRDRLLRSFWLPFGELRLAPLGFEALGLARLGRSVERSDLRARTLWEILASAGARVAVLGEPAALGSDVAAFASDERFRGGSLAEATPAALEGRLRLLADVGEPPPHLAVATSPRGGEALATLATLQSTALAQDRFRAAVAESLAQSGEPPDALFVALPGFAEVALSTRAGFEAAELEGSRGRAERAAAELLTAYAGELDAMLTLIWERLPPPRLLAVVSPYGVDRPRGFERLVREAGRTRRLGGTLAGQPDGALWLYGEGLARAGVSIPGARVVDVAPTLLYLAGLPIARDFDGRVLTEAIEPDLLTRQPLTFVPSYGALGTTGAMGAPATR